jgi:GT2 family glycosyltransferase
MLCRTDALKAVQGFDDKYFLYFEDFALSIKLREIGKISYLSSMKIQHFGGEASRKGLKHIYYFLSSAFKFYQEFGWKII